MFKLDLESQRNQRSNWQHLLDRRKSQRVQKKSTSALLTVPEPLTVWITTNCGKFLKSWEYQTTWPASWEICMQVRKQQLEQDMKQQTGSKSGKEYIKAVYCHPAYLTYMQSTSCKMPGWMTISFKQSCGISRANVAMWVTAGTEIQKSWIWSGSATATGSS